MPLVLLVGLFVGFVVGCIYENYAYTSILARENETQENTINSFVEALERENCQVAWLPLWQLKVKNLAANQAVMVNTDNIRAGNITFMSNNGVNSIKIPAGNYPYLDAVRAMRQAVQGD